MSRSLRALMMIVLLASCGGDRGSAPRDLDNACAIVTERPQYVKALRASERRWGVPPHVLMAIIYQESKFISNARTPHRFALGIIPLGRQSSAYGYSQALDATWEEYQDETRNRFSKRDRINDATDFMGWYMAGARDRNGIALTDARNQYLAYHEGYTGYARGSYNSKAWLLRVADDVGMRAQIYRAQLEGCRRMR